MQSSLVQYKPLHANNKTYACFLHHVFGANVYIFQNNFLQTSVNDKNGTHGNPTYNDITSLNYYYLFAKLIPA